jgi:hypothetical protein
LKFRFHFSKTKFHGGRLLASFVPATKDAFTNTVNSSSVPIPEISGGLIQPFQYSTVFDLRDNNVFELEVPYVSSRPWLSVNGFSGGVSLTVLDPLVASGETSSTITYLVEVCAGPDFELACFTGSGLAPATTLNTLAVYQSGFTDTNEVSQYTMGEKVSSLKELIMIPYNAYLSYPATSYKQITMPNWWYAPSVPAAIPMADTSYYMTTSTANLVARCYSFVSGGTSYAYFNDSRTAHLVSFQLSTWDNLGGVASLGDYRRKPTVSRARVISSGRENVSHAKMPTFQKVLRVPSWAQLGFNLDFSSFTAMNSSFLFCGTQTTMFVDNNSTSTIQGIVSYAASDDARAFSYIGPPPCFLFGSAQVSDVEKGNFSSFV